MAEKYVKLTAEFSATQVTEAIVKHFGLPSDTNVNFIVGKVYSDPRDEYGTIKFKKATATFTKKLDEVL